MSKSSHSRKSSSTKSNEGKDEDHYRSIYLSLFNDLDEEITTLDELTLLLQYAGCNPSKKGLIKYWSDNTDSYTFTQFCSILRQERNTSKEDLMKAFEKIDINNDGFITHDELFEILTKRGERMTKAEVKLMIEDADFNGDGKLDYPEFCSMMDATTKQLKQLHSAKSKSIENDKSNLSDEKRRNSYVNKGNDQKKSSLKNESKASSSTQRKLSSNVSSSKSPTRDFESKEKMKEQPVQSKVSSEPKDLAKWQFDSSKGCFHKEEDGSLTSHQFQIKITQPTSIWITIKASRPKYGKINDTILDCDMTLYLVENSTGKLISFSDAIIDGKSCLYADIDIGVFNIFTFSTGCKLSIDHSESGKIVLAKGSEDDCRLTKLCKDSLMEIFYRSDLDGNGFLNRQEFNEFQKRSSGEECDNEAWDVVKETVDLNPHDEITLKGFLDLNLMEVRDPDGGQDELWVTLESLGYSHKLLLIGACPFSLEVYTKKGQNKLSLLGIRDGGTKLYDAVLESIKIASSSKQIKNKRDLHLLVANFVNKFSIAVENQSHSSVKIQIDGSSSENLISSQSMNVTTEVNSKSISIVNNFVPDNTDIPTRLKYQETILKS